MEVHLHITMSYSFVYKMPNIHDSAISSGFKFTEVIIYMYIAIRTYIYFSYNIAKVYIGTYSYMYIMTHYNIIIMRIQWLHYE